MARLLCLALIGLAVFAAHAPAAGKRFAVVVGVQKYDDPAFRPLRNPGRDAADLAAALAPAGYEVTALSESAGGKDQALAPTKANIAAALKATLAKCGRDDVVLVAFAGHGVRSDARTAGYLCPKDAKPLPDGKESLVAVSDLCEQLSASKAGAAVLLVDACPAAPARDRPAGIDGSGFRAPPRVFALFSCSPKEHAAEADGGGGLFFAQVAAGLKGPAADGNDAVTFASLAGYVRAAVAKKAARAAPQTPSAHAPEGARASPVLARHPAAIPDAEWKEYLAVWSNGSTRPFLVKYATKRLAAWRKSAEAGSARGMMLLADCHEFGAGVPRDAKESAKWYAAGAAHGNTFAMVGLGICYQRGFGVARDPKEAVKWFKKGADLGDPGCMVSLGECYLGGLGAEKDAKEAFKWYQQAADLGFGQAALAMANSYLRGTGVEKNVNEALKWFKKGIDMGHGASALSLALLYQDGDGVKKDPAEAVKWFRKGYELASAECALFLGLCYFKGEGVAKDEKQAAGWCRKAADLGQVIAMKILARCYLNGVGVEADEKEAIAWLRKAAEQDDPEAMLELGACYLKGVGVEKDRAGAARWLRKSAALGNAKAKELLKTLSD